MHGRWKPNRLKSRQTATAAFGYFQAPFIVLHPPLAFKQLTESLKMKDSIHTQLTNRLTVLSPRHAIGSRPATHSLPHRARINSGDCNRSQGTSLRTVFGGTTYHPARDCDQSQRGIPAGRHVLRVHCSAPNFPEGTLPGFSVALSLTWLKYPTPTDWKRAASVGRYSV